MERTKMDYWCSAAVPASLTSWLVLEPIPHHRSMGHRSQLVKIFRASQTEEIEDVACMYMRVVVHLLTIDTDRGIANKKRPDAQACMPCDDRQGYCRALDTNMARDAH